LKDRLNKIRKKFESLSIDSYNTIKKILHWR